MNTMTEVLTNYSPETIMIDGKARATRNSENRLIHRSYAELCEFWEWFGDSKAVDKQNRPIVAYHGTHSIFSEFKKGKNVNFNNPQRLLGFFFTEDKDYAAQYGDILMPVYLNVSNPHFSDSARIDAIENGSDRNARAWVKLRKDKGHDGLVFGDGNTIEWVAFNSCQIKSASIGIGYSGEVFRIGHEVEKNSTNDEAKVFAALKDVNGIAKGYELNGKIRLPFYDQVISVDTIDPDSRESLADIIRPNIERINNAISALTRTGYDYNDPLQFGVNKDGTMDLLDFSIASNNYPKEALSNNFSALSRFYQEFGLKAVGVAVAKAKQVIGLQHSRLNLPLLRTFLREDVNGVDYRKIEKALGGKRAGYAYYVTHAESVDLPGIAQTEFIDGVSVILSIRQLTSDEVTAWHMVNVYADTDNTPFFRNTNGIGQDIAEEDDSDLVLGCSL